MTWEKLEIILVIGVILFLWSELFAALFWRGNKNESTSFEDAKYNRNLYKTGKADRSKKVYTSIRPDLGDDPNTASGYVERSRPVEKE
jgi:hypothetical protein